MLFVSNRRCAAKTMASQRASPRAEQNGWRISGAWNYSGANWFEMRQTSELSARYARQQGSQLAS